MAIGQELLNVPMGDMIRSMAMAIADGQAALDRSSMRTTEMMSGQILLRDDKGALIDSKGAPTSAPSFADSRVYFGYVYDLDNVTKLPTRKPLQVSMMELGFTPNFYQFIDTIIEVKISISITSSSEKSGSSTVDSTEKKDSVQPSWWGQRTTSNVVSTSQVNAAYSSKYSYSAEGSSLLRTKLVPVPPPAILEERIREVMSIERAYEQWKLLNNLHVGLQKELAANPTDKKLEAELAAARADAEEARITLTGGNRTASSDRPA